MPRVIECIKIAFFICFFLIATILLSKKGPFFLLIASHQQEMVSFMEGILERIFTKIRTT